MLLSFNYVEELASISKMLMQSGHFDAALVFAKRIVHRFPAESSGYKLCAELSMKVKRVTEAKIYIRKLLKIDRNVLDAHLMLGEILIEEGNGQELTDLIRELKILFPNNTRVDSFIAMALKYTPVHSLRRKIEITDTVASAVLPVENSESLMRVLR